MPFEIKQYLSVLNEFKEICTEFKNYERDSESFFRYLLYYNVETK